MTFEKLECPLVISWYAPLPRHLSDNGCNYSRLLTVTEINVPSQKPQERALQHPGYNGQRLYAITARGALTAPRGDTPPIQARARPQAPARPLLGGAQ